MQMQSEKLLRARSVTEVSMTLATLRVHGQECGAPGSSKNLVSGDAHPLMPKGGHDSLIPLFSSIYPVFIMCGYSATKVLPHPHPSWGVPHVAHVTSHLPFWATGAWG